MSSPGGKGSLFPGPLRALQIPKPAGPVGEGKWVWLVHYNIGGHFRAVGMSVSGCMATVGLDCLNTTQIPLPFESCFGLGLSILL